MAKFDESILPGANLGVRHGDPEILARGSVGQSDVADAEFTAWCGKFVDGAVGGEADDRPCGPGYRGRP